jgi:hypothetical protein
MVTPHVRQYQVRLQAKPWKLWHVAGRSRGTVRARRLPREMGGLMRDPLDIGGGNVYTVQMYDDDVRVGTCVVRATGAEEWTLVKISGP